MTVFDAHISGKVADFLVKMLRAIEDFKIANQYLYAHSGIVHFFSNNDELSDFKIMLSVQEKIGQSSDRAEYGDFQTNIDLSLCR